LDKGKPLRFERVGEEVVLTDEQKEFIRTVYKLAELNTSQLDVIKQLEEVWGVAIVVYERK